ncbi:hypothetical protein BDZ91DRAFT_729445, partial [Kalaharituber pfeilii]
MLSWSWVCATRRLRAASHEHFGSWGCEVTPPRAGLTPCSGPAALVPCTSNGVS